MFVRIGLGVCEPLALGVLNTVNHQHNKRAVQKSLSNGHDPSVRKECE